MPFKIEIIDFIRYREEILSLRSYSWAYNQAGIIKDVFYSKEDEIEDLASMHCTIFDNERLIAIHRFNVPEIQKHIDDHVTMIKLACRKLVDIIVTTDEFYIKLKKLKNINYQKISHLY